MRGTVAAEGKRSGGKVNIDQPADHGALERVFQAAAVDGGVGQRPAAGVDEVGGELVGERGALGQGVHAGQRADLVQRPGGQRGGQRGLDGIAAAQVLQGLADVAAVVDQRDAGLAGQAGEGGVGHQAGGRAGGPDQPGAHAAGHAGHRDAAGRSAIGHARTAANQGCNPKSSLWSNILVCSTKSSMMDRILP